MPIIVGVPRSGTTLLRFMMDAHPALAIPPETGFLEWSSKFWKTRWMPAAATREAVFRVVTRLPLKSGSWRDFGISAKEFRIALQQIEPFDAAEGFRAFYRLYARKQNKPRYGDKTPLYCRHLSAIEKLLPEAHFIHVIRDGRDVALSLRETWFSPGRDMRTLAKYWSHLVRETRKAGSHARNYMEVHYEQLMHDPAAVLANVCCFLKLDFDSAMQRYWERTPQRLTEHRTLYRIDGRALITHDGRVQQQLLAMQPPRAERAFCWKREMTRQEQSDFECHAAPALQELGYGLTES